MNENIVEFEFIELEGDIVDSFISSSDNNNNVC